MATVSQQVKVRIVNSRKVKSATEGLSATVASKVGDVLAPQSAGLDPQRAQQLLVELLGLLGATLGRAADALEATEHAYTAEQADDAPVRTRRDTSADAIRSGMLQLKDLLSAYLGASAQKTYGVEGDLPSTPDALFTTAKNTLQLLAKTPASASGPLGGFSTSAALAFLEPLTAGLGSALADVDKESRELKDRLGVRDAELDRWAPVYQGVASIVSGLFLLGGRPDLAESVKPTARRTSGQEEAPALPPQPNPDAPA